MNARQVAAKYGDMKIDWILPEFLVAGEITILGGGANVGKSTFVLGMLKRIADGSPWVLGNSPAKYDFKSLYYSMELGWVPLAKRFRQLWGDGVPENVEVEAPDETPKLNKDGWEKIKARCKETRARVLVLDPLFGTDMGVFDSNRNEDVSRILNHARDIARELNVSVVLVHHTRKGPRNDLLSTSNSDEQLDELSGSKMFVNRPAIRIVIKSRGGVRREIHLYSRLGPRRKWTVALEDGLFRQSQRGDYQLEPEEPADVQV
jgi:RecA-family ATPase